MGRATMLRWRRAARMPGGRKAVGRPRQGTNPYSIRTCTCWSRGRGSGCAGCTPRSGGRGTDAESADRPSGKVSPTTRGSPELVEQQIKQVGAVDRAGAVLISEKATAAATWARKSSGPACSSSPSPQQARNASRVSALLAAWPGANPARQHVVWRRQWVVGAGGELSSRLEAGRRLGPGFPVVGGQPHVRVGDPGRAGAGLAGEVEL